MKKRSFYRWSIWVFLLFLGLSLYNGWILLPGFYKDSYFRFEAPEGLRTMRSERGLTVYIRKNVGIRYFSRCHHYAFENNSELLSDKCWIRVFLVGPIPKFSNHDDFFIEAVSQRKKSSRIDTQVFVIESEHEWAQISFKDNNHPSNIRLVIPDVEINNEQLEVPEMFGSYIEKIRFDIFAF